MEEQKRPNWTPGAIAVITCLALGGISWAISEYRPTAAGQNNWEIAAWTFGGLAVVGFILGFLLTKRRRS